jgi:hypothetical protein
MSQLKDREDIGDGVEYVNRIRNRPLAYGGVAASSAIMLSVIGCMFSVDATAQRNPPTGRTVDVSDWKTFANKAGWSIKYPGNWIVGSCRQCSDPTDANMVTLSNPSTSELIMIEHLIDKPGDQSVEQWLNDVNVSTNLGPIVSQEWVAFGGTRALKVINGRLDTTESENIYLVHDSKTFAIRADPKTFSHSPGLRVLSSFRFANR